ncbi:MAG TPA: CHAD domain-containing protein [Bryobacteraceae bacterium]|nr:CHAD domain-containing protein [Bryobacteraceae bacterium]
MKKKTSMEWDALLGAGENARLRLPAVVAEFFALGRQAAASEGPTQLHAFRLAAKRFRYTLELFRPLYGPGLEPRVEAVRKIQSMLGDRQDFTVLSARLRNTLAPSDALLDALRACEEKGRELEQRFEAYWRDEFDTAGAELRWVRYLTRRPATIRVRPELAQPITVTAPATRKRPSHTARTRR